jgi:hypothetical protein
MTDEDESESTDPGVIVVESGCTMFGTRTSRVQREWEINELGPKAVRSQWLWFARRCSP